jgi:hypothetical protein
LCGVINCGNYIYKKITSIFIAISSESKKLHFWTKANSSKEKAKTGLFAYDSVLEMTTKNMGNSSIFLSITHTTLSAKQFRCYGILKIDFAAEFCFWTEQRLNRTQLLRLRLAENPEVPNTITVGHSLSFLIVHNTAPNG